MLLPKFYKTVVEIYDYAEYNTHDQLHNTTVISYKHMLVSMNAEIMFVQRKNMANNE